jgi:hypothetical protein
MLARAVTCRSKNGSQHIKNEDQYLEVVLMNIYFAVCVCKKERARARARERELVIVSVCVCVNFFLPVYCVVLCLNYFSLFVF